MNPAGLSPQWQFPVRLPASGQGIHEIARWSEVFNEDLLLRAPFHTHLANIEIGGFVGSEQDVVVGRILVLFEHRRQDVAAEMIVSPGSEMAGA